MPNRLVPMLNVPDVLTTARWYEELGFTVRAIHQEEGCDADWALLALDGGELMLNLGGVASSAERREVDLYWHTAAIEPLFERFAAKARVVEAIHATFYGTREFIIKDCNGFWLTFSEPAAS